MSSGKKILHLLFRTSVTILLLWYIFSQLIQFDDSIVLVNGQNISGEIVHHDNTSIVVKAGEENFTFALSEVRQEKGKKSIRYGFVSILKQVHWQLFLLFCLLPLANVLLTSFRLMWLLKSQQIPTTLGRCCVINFIGYFFNNFLPGSTGGDLAKGYYLVKETSEKMRVVMVVIMDRVVGLSALVCVTSIFLVFRLGEDAFFIPTILMFCGVLGVFVLVLVIFFFPRRLLEKRESFLFRLISVFCDFRNHPKYLAMSFLISTAIHISTNAMFFGFGQSLAIQEVPWYAYFIYPPTIFVIIALPISLAGWGVGEASYSYFFTQVGASSEKAVILSILGKLALVIVGVIGGFVWLFQKKIIDLMSKSSDDSDD